MSPAAHGTVGFRASPRLYRGKVVMLALAVAVVALAEALRTEVREEVARPAEPEGVERMVLDGADTVIAAEAAGKAVLDVVVGEAAGPFAARLSVICTDCGCHVRSLPLAPRAS